MSTRLYERGMSDGMTELTEGEGFAQRTAERKAEEGRGRQRKAEEGRGI
jgi:hypothetical protein